MSKWEGLPFAPRDTKADSKRRKKQKQVPFEDYGWIVKVRSLPCCICGAPPRSQAHHWPSKGIGGWSDYLTIPLCLRCHTGGAEAFHVLRLRQWERRHGVAITELVATTKTVLDFVAHKARRDAALAKGHSGRGMYAKSHGEASSGKRTVEYQTWKEIHRRCNDPRRTNYERYGGRGIKVCLRWRSFEMFLADVGRRPEGPSRHWQLERNDNDGDYEPKNCRWATATEQAENRRTTVRFEINGITQSAKAWARECGVNYWTVRARLSRGLSIENALKNEKEFQHENRNRTAQRGHRQRQHGAARSA